MRKLLILLPLLAVGGIAQAADNGFYVGGGVSQAKLDNIGDDFDTGDLNDFKLHDTAWKAIVGFRPMKLFAIEANYDDLGSENRVFGSGEFRANAKAFSAYGMLFAPIPVVDLYAKAGLARWKTNARADGLFDLNDKGTDFAYGVGAQVNFGSLAARLEYEQFDIKHTDGVELLTLGLTYTFL